MRRPFFFFPPLDDVVPRVASASAHHSAVALARNCGYADIYIVNRFHTYSTVQLCAKLYCTVHG